MSREERIAHLKDLVFEERELRKHINCMLSKAKRTRELVDTLLEPLDNPYNLDFDQIEKTAGSIDWRVPELISDLRSELNRLHVVQKEIQSIESP